MKSSDYLNATRLVFLSTWYKLLSIDAPLLYNSDIQLVRTFGQDHVLNVTLYSRMKKQQGRYAFMPVSVDRLINDTAQI